MFDITKSTENKDVPVGMSLANARAGHLKIVLNSKFKSKLPLPEIRKYEGVSVLHCDETNYGFKGLAAERLIASIKEDVIVYCAPRAGHAAMAVAGLAKLYKKRAVFFSPAAKSPTTHQACVIALGAELRFVRIAAMPVLNHYAREWAIRHGAAFLPFGLAGLPLVTTGIVDLAVRIGQEYRAPKEFWCAVSTGTMIRGLQIGWPNAVAKGVAVARNLHDGEIGNASIVSAQLPFLKPAKTQPPFKTTSAYDAKAWEVLVSSGANKQKNVMFINVGKDESIEKITSTMDLS
jgi:hypothetical protein